MVKESGHYLARVPSVRSEYSHVVPLPPFRSHSSAITGLQHQEALSFLQQAVLGNNPHNLVCAGVHERCHGVVERHAARTMLPVTRCSTTDDHPQRIQGWRSCMHIVPDVSCDFSCHEPALDTTVLGPLPPFVCRAVGWSWLCTNVRGPGRPHSGLCKVSQAFSGGVRRLHRTSKSGMRFHVFGCIS